MKNYLRHIALICAISIFTTLLSSVNTFAENVKKEVSLPKDKIIEKQEDEIDEKANTELDNQDKVDEKANTESTELITLHNQDKISDKNDKLESETFNINQDNKRSSDNNDSMSNATPLTLGKKYTGNIESKNDYDYYKIILNKDGLLELDFSHELIPGDSQNRWAISVLDSYNNQYISMESSGNEEEIYTNIGLAKGTYYILVKPYQKSSYSTIYWSNRDYNIKATLKEGNYEKEFNNGMGSANTINSGEKYTGRIQSSGDYDYYKITLDKDGLLELDFSHTFIPGDSQNRWKISILDAKNNQYISMNSAGNEEENYTSIGLAKGTYYILIKPYQASSYSSIYWSNKYYHIKATLKSGNYEKEFNNGMGNSNTINIDKKYVGRIQDSNDKDYYCFTIDSNKELKINFNHDKVTNFNQNYWQIKILDGYNNVYADFKSTGGDITKEQMLSLNKGTYYILVDTVYESYRTYYCTIPYEISVMDLSKVAVTSVKLNKTSLSLLKGKTETLKATVAPSNATNKDVTWTSSNTKVAKVDANGKVTAVAAGTATITVKTKDGSKTATCKVTVKSPVKVTSVKLNKTSLSLLKGKTETLKATVAPSNATNKDVTWKSSNTKVATVDANGTVKGVAAGSATITVTTKDGSKTATCKVTIKNPVKVTSVKLNKTSLSLLKGKTETLIATIAPSNATNKNVTWTSSNTKVATVDSNGKVTAVAAGTANITVKTKDGSKTATCKVTVTNPVKVTSVKLNKTSLSLIKGKAETLKATIAPSNATNKNVTWTSSNTKVATVDSNGKVTAVAAGTATITVKTKDGSKTATCKVTVTNPVKVTSVNLNKTNLSLTKGKTETLKATVAPSNATNKDLTWFSSNESVAKVDANGKVTAVGKGTAIIAACSEEELKIVACKVVVTN